MNNHIDHTNQRDGFSESIRRKLEFHESPTDPAWWVEIESAIPTQKQKKRIPFWFWIPGGAAVATLAFLLMLPPFTGKQPSVARYMPEARSSNQPMGKPSEPVRHAGESFSADRTPRSLQGIIPASPATPATIEKHRVHKKNTTDSSALKGTRSNPAEQVEAQQVNETHENKPTPKEAKENKPASTTNKTRPIPETLTEKTGDKIQPGKRKKEWLLAANFSSGNSTSVSNGNGFIPTDAGNNMPASPPPPATRILSPNDFSKQNFRAPLSFGITARKPLNGKLGLETGLVYTLLSSTFEEKAATSYDASLNLHYVGVPVNLYFDFWQSRKWQAYVSAGGMLEKGLQSVYTQNEHAGNATHTTISKTSIDGFQWSLNGGIGLAYLLQRNIGLYFEPKFSYFFDNNQPVSARTDKPTAIGLSSGIRFQL
ncbi:MAG TPA: porin family protein [Paludibacter sp.]|nr:porin family protein [Paludibacter sp.]